MEYPIVVAHGARLNKNYPPNTLKGIVDCAGAGFSHIEVDISAHENGDFFLFHSERFDAITNKRGSVFNLDKSGMKDLWYINKKKEKVSPVSSLDELVEIMEKDEGIKELQLDFKMYPSSLVTDKILNKLIGIINPVKKRIRITSCADWIILRLCEIDSSIKLGFDPQFYIDYREREEAKYPPFKKNVFDYLDDHPISMQNWNKPEDYLSSRAVSLWNLGAKTGIWYIRYSFLIKSYKDGFNWVEFLHQKGAGACAWTVDLDNGSDMSKAEFLIKMGIDRITTNTPEAWIKMIKKF